MLACRRRPGIAVLLSLVMALNAVAQVPSAANNTITPTVTTETGDTGGKFFGRPPDPARTRRYYIAAEPQLWDYAPAGNDPICGKPLPPDVVSRRQGSKVRYVQYTDDTFLARVPDDPRLGILGPVVRGVVGDFAAITFLNRAPRPLSMHPHGVKYDKDSEGSYYRPGPGLGAAVAPGAKFTYVWQLDENSGPLPGEPGSKGWLYHSHVAGDEEANLGLVGIIIVTDPNRARPDGTPADADREMASLFMIFDESGLGEAEREAAEYADLPGGGPPPKTWTQVQQLTEQGARYAINGYVFGNAPGLEMNEGERVRWYLFALGSETDFHTAHWHGLRVAEEGRRRTDTVELLPASMKVADMVADNPGSWLFHCHVAEHMMEGMFARVIVHPKAAGKPGPAFFGLAGTQSTLQVRSAEMVSGELHLEGAVTVFEAFSTFSGPVRFQLGGRTIEFHPDQHGAAVGPDGSFRVKNASPFGVVYGGSMEFEATFPRAYRLRQPGPPGTETNAAHEFVLPLTMQLGAARHDATVRVKL